jgi:hypothetical protein
MMMPTANHVAWAIVAACRETGENPLVVAGDREPRSRARHYAFQALKVVFPDVKKERLAFMVGCSGKPEYYAVNSTNGMGRFVGGPHVGERIHRFWDEGVFERVIAAIKLPPEEEESPPTRQPVKLSAATGSIVEPTRPAAAPGKRALQDMLAQAVRNTAAMTPVSE